MQNEVWAEFKQLSRGSQDVVMDITEFVATPEEAQRKLEHWRNIDRITQATYEEITANVTFVIDAPA